MPREKRYESAADRQRAYRERQKAVEAELGERVKPVSSPAVPPELSDLEARKLAEALEGARRVSVELRESPERAEDRLARVERYFHWRLESFRAGETVTPW